MKTTTICLLFSLMLYGQGFAADYTGQPSRSTLTIQYLPNSGYETVIGLGWYNLKSASTGLYINGQTTAQSTSSRDDYYEDLSIGSFGDPVTGYISDFVTINFGATYSVSENFGLFLGLGYASVRGYAEKFDPMYILDSDGSYLVRDTAVDESGANGNGGVIMRLGRVAIEIGYHSYVDQGYVGVGMSF